MRNEKEVNGGSIKNLEIVVIKIDKEAEPNDKDMLRFQIDRTESCGS